MSIDTRLPAAGGVSTRLARARDVLAFEWTKLRSIPSYRWTLIIAAAVTLGLAAVVANALASTPTAHPGPIDPLVASFLAYAEYTVLPVTIVSVQVFTAEHSSGLIRTTFTAVPRRWAVLAAKAAVTGTVAFLAGELIAAACFLLSQAIQPGHHHGLSLSHPGVLAGLLVAGFFLAVCALVGVGVGAIVRHTAGGIAASLSIVYLLALLCLALPSPWRATLGRFTMPFAAYQAIALHPSPSLLSPGLSVLVLIAWPAATLLTAALVITRRDI